MANKYAKNINSRRNFLGSLAAVSGLTFLPASFVKKTDLNKPESSPELIPENTFPIYNVCNFGAVGDGVNLNTAVIQNVIDSCSKSGGGTVFFPPGNFVTGTFQIKSNVNIYLSAGATIWGSTDLSDYKSGLVYAEDAKNISITGMGAINGNGKAFFGKFLNRGISEEEMRQKMKRPGNMMTFVRCNNVLLEDITVENSPVWTIHPIDCERVTITGISILNGVYDEDGPNTDGINPDGCSKVRISDCYLRCGDDCIVIKVTNRKGGNKVCRDIVVTNCVLQSSETALKIGTESYGEFRNITFSNCVIHDSAGGIGLHMRDGGLIDGMVVNNITVDCDRKRSQGIFIWSFRRTDDTPWGMIRNVIISDMTLTGGGGIFISGVKEKHIEGLTLENIRINIIEGRNTKSHDDPPYPFEVCGNEEAPYDIFCRYVDDLIIRNVQLNWSKPEVAKWGSALRCWHIRDLEIAGFVGRQSLTSNAPAIWLKDVKGAFIHNCRAPEGTGTFLQLDEGTGRVTIIGNEFSQAKELYKAGSGVDAKEIFETANRLPG